MSMSTRATFRQHEHLKTPQDFRRAFDRRRSASDQALIVYGVENGLEYTRLGISVSRKKVRRATDRNRLKRIIREAFRLSKGSGELPIGLDLIVLPRGNRLSFEEARRGLPLLVANTARRLRLPARKSGPATPPAS